MGVRKLTNESHRLLKRLTLSAMVLAIAAAAGVIHFWGSTVSASEQGIGNNEVLSTDFSEYDVGEGVPDGWKELWSTSDYKIADSPSRLVKTSTGEPRHLLAWEEAGEIEGDVEIAALIRVPNATLPHMRTTPFQLHLLASGESGAINTYHLDYTGTDRNGLRIRKSVDNGQITLGNEMLPFEFHTWHHVVFQREGDMLRAKIWPYFTDEPDEWTLEVQDDTHHAGRVGIGFYSERMTQEFAWFSVGTGDQEAERAPDHLDGIPEPQVPDVVEPEGKAQDGAVVITWPEADGADHYEIKRDGELIAHGWENPSFADPNIEPGTSSTYQVRGVNTLEGRGEWSEELEVEAKPIPDDLALPFELKDSNPWTTHEQELTFLDELEEVSSRVSVEEIGRSGEGRPIHLARFGMDGPPDDADIAERPTVLIAAGNHGNEKASQEGVLLYMRKLATSEDPKVIDFLNNYAVLVVPKINPDGAAANTRHTVIPRLDPNRDFLNLVTSETQTMAKVLRDYQPDVVIDAHEWYANSGSQRGELEISTQGNLNAHQDILDLSYEMTFDRIMEKSNKYAGWRSSPYEELFGQASIFHRSVGMKHALSMVIETSRHAEVRRLEEEGLGSDAPEFRPRRVESQRFALNEAMEWMTENVDRVAEATAKSREAAKSNEGPMYLKGSVYDPPETDGVIDPPLCGWMLNDIEGSALADILNWHGIEWENLTLPRPGVAGQEVTFVPAAQLMRGFALMALDSGSDYQLDGVNSIRLEEGSGWCDPEDPPEDITAEDIILLVEQLDEAGEFESDKAVRTLSSHLKAVSHYENQEEAEKIVRHMEGFQDLLAHQLEHQLISEGAFHELYSKANALINQWQ